MNPVVADERARAVYLGFLASSAAGLLVWALTRKTARVFATSALVCPGCVADLAAQLPASSEDEFILAAWDLAGTGIGYEPVGSHLDFTDSTVSCERCLLPRETLTRGVANCVGHAALLASLLRYRLPADRVLMAVGQLATDGVGGHAWAEVFRQGQWYILESTKGPGPWVPASAVSSLYIPEILFNDETVLCNTPSLCLDIGDCHECLPL